MEVDLLGAVRLSLGVAAASTLVILPFGVFLGWLMARKSWRGKVLVETLVALPDGHTPGGHRADTALALWTARMDRWAVV